MEDHTKAILCHERAIEIRQETLDEDNPALVTSYSNVGLVHDSREEYLQALVYFELSLDIRRRSLPSAHPDTRALVELIEHLKQKS